ncbi:hypothetical protein MNBD_UNCLBAC01-932 [hydrothermal vent metagenome]|uniref:Uncharacterized protein n=1 Tax=hydrothermal vent metagenome TaxID=652676 RepID=A0A3B1DMY6_9ZZZZ
MSKFQRYLSIFLIVIVGIVFFRFLKGRGVENFSSEEAGILSSFEVSKPWGVSPEKGFSLKRSKKYVTEGKYSLKVVYPKRGLPSINTRRLKHDWGEYEYFAFDVYNPQKETINFTIRLDDTKRKRINIPYKLNSGINKIKIPRSKIISKIDAANVGFIVLFINEPRKRYTLYFDNMRLEKTGLIAGIENFKKIDSLQRGKPLSVRKAVPLPKPDIAKKGALKVTLIKLKKVLNNRPLISTGIPFEQGKLLNSKNIVFFDGQKNEIPIAVKVLARWPQDQSIRSILVQFQYPIEKIYEYVTMLWGASRRTKDLKIMEPLWDYPEGYLILPAPWLCASGVIGEQVPMKPSINPPYDTNIVKKFPEMKAKSWTGNLKKDGYYSTPHVFYQFYVRSGELKHFLAARKELIHYREDSIIHEGKDRGQSKAGSKPRYIYMQAMMDDYFLTGDPRTLQVAQEMAKFLKKNYKPQKAFYAKEQTNFWTERLQAFPLLGFITYFEMTNDREYLKLAEEYMKNVYKTQLEWPSRGGFIHNLYAHDPEEGARPDEYGGSPFMTGLLLEAIIKYHRITKSDIAADSIFRALDWLINEGLAASGDTFKYTTADTYLNSSGTPDLNLLVAHAFGYGYKISGYQKKEYLDIGMKVFNRGVKNAYLGTRKHFNQNFRSSGHFLAYIKDGLSKKGDISASKTEGGSRFKNLLYFENFEHSSGRFKSSGNIKLEIDKQNVYLNGNALKIKIPSTADDFSFGTEFDNWNIDQYSLLSFAYRIPKGASLGIRVKTKFGDWVCLGGTATYSCEGGGPKSKYKLIDDGEWHEIDMNIKYSVRNILAKIKRLTAFQLHIHGSADTGHFWIDDFRIKQSYKRLM